MRYVIALLIMAKAAVAECPPVPDHSDRYYAALTEVRLSPTEYAARQKMGALWEILTEAPDAAAQEMLDAGMQSIREADYSGALEELNALVAYCPEYAEGYNQRAFASFLLTDYGPALVDLTTTLELFPDHVGAQSGLVLTLIGLGRDDEAQAVLREALTLNPWMPERHLLREPDGEEL